MPPPHSRRPVRHGVARGVQFGEPRLLEADEFLVADPGLGRPPVRRDVLSHQARTSARNSVEVGRHAYSPVRPSLPARRVNCVARRGQAERQPPQRLAVARQPRQRGLVAEADRAVQLMADPEDHLGRLDGRHPQRERVVEGFGLIRADAPQRVLGEDLQPAALDFGVGELELHALERRQRLPELLAQADVGDGQLDRAVEHAEQRPARQHQSERHVGRSVVVDRPTARARRRTPAPAMPRSTTALLRARPVSLPPSGSRPRRRHPRDGWRRPRSDPSTSRSAGRASRSATGYGTAQ